MKFPDKTILSIAVLGTCGVLARYAVGLAVENSFFVNILGSFLIGVVYVLGNKRAVIPAFLRTGIMVGFLGGFTTFSSYCLDAVKLLENGKYLTAALYFAGSPAIGLVAALAGITLTQKAFDFHSTLAPVSQELGDDGELS